MQINPEQQVVLLNENGGPPKDLNRFLVYFVH